MRLDKCDVYTTKGYGTGKIYISAARGAAKREGNKEKKIHKLKIKAPQEGKERNPGNNRIE